MFIHERKLCSIYVVIMKAINAVGWFPLRTWNTSCNVEIGFVEVLKVCGIPGADSFNRGHDRKALFAMIKTSAFLPLASRVL
jgi:hypothetical protein